MPDFLISDCLQDAEVKLKHIENPQLYTLVLMAHVLNQPKTWLLAHSDALINSAEKQSFFSLVDRLADGEPLPYITGTHSFFGLAFKVSPDVLIPRPETELVVEEALRWLRATPKANHALDVGTGSGCIAISLLHQSPDLQVTAIDISESALAIAKVNAEKHGVNERFQAMQSDLLSNYEGKTRLICANLPYIPSKTLEGLDVLDWEPRLALNGGADGLDKITLLLKQAHDVLDRPGLILLEIEETIGASTLKIAHKAYPDAKIELIQDLAGKDRLVRIEVR